MYIKEQQLGYALLFLIGFISFLLLLKWHKREAFKKNHKEQLIQINENEIAYLTEGALPFDDGTDFIDPAHPYSNDLDIMGSKSLYQHLNRTSLYKGRAYLAQYLHHKSSAEDILANQAAIKELSERVVWRQDFLAFAELDADSKSQYDRLIAWANEPQQPISIFHTIASYLIPIITITAGALYTFMDQPIIWEVLKYGFLANLAITASLLKPLKKEVEQITDIDRILNTYSRLIASVEKEKFDSEKLKTLQGKLAYDQDQASVLIKKLSYYFGQLDNIQNPIGAILVNGLTMFHVHSFKNMQNWKEKHAAHIADWIDTLGALEALSSLANFSHNNPTNTYPQINNDFQLSFTELGHPLISATQRINNDISFNEQRFIILTGSNMSGKSTFLRSLGINMVLANCGASICASAANIHPLPVLVSMRVSDSLNDNESYFFAEVKRLKFLLEEAKQRQSLLLLDEILRGTNSNDKRAGTVAVIEKIISNQAFGAIATHDLKVCDTSDAHPDDLVNKCFEVDIKNNELVFDYKLKNGICQNQSATFLMKKMEVI